MPRPSLLMTSVTTEPMTLPMVTVICGAVIVAFHVFGSVVLPFRVRLKVPLNVLVPVVMGPTVRAGSPTKVTLFATVRAAPTATRLVPLPIVRVPVPSGPAVTTPRRVLALLSAPRRMPPPFWATLTPPVKVLVVLLSWRLPAPVLAMPPFWMSEVMFSPACHGATSLVFTKVWPTLMPKEPLAFRSRLPPLMMETVPAFEVVAAMLPVTVRMPVGDRVGAAPPLLLKVRFVTLLFPVKVTTELPFIVNACVPMLPPAVWVRVPALTVMPPVPRTPVAPTVRVPEFTTVPPV